MNFSSYSGPLRAVIFDWAGTTIDFGSLAPVTAVMRAFEAFEVPISRQQARGPMGKAKRDHLLEILQLPEVSQRWRKVHGTTATDEVDRIYERFLPLQEQILAEHSTLIPGCLETVDHCRTKGMKIGSSTGYTRELMNLLEPLAEKQGYKPDASLCASDLSPGRPAPWMCLENARRLGVFPPQAIVKVDDTTVGIQAGLNAGMWTVGVAATGNLMGLSLEEYSELEGAERNRRLDSAHSQFRQAGAHLVVDTIADLPAALAEIEDSLTASR